MDEFTALGLWWLPLTVWLGFVVLAVWHGFLLRRYRREGLLPVKTVQRDMDLLFGRYDHLPHLRFVRRTGIALIAVFLLSGAVVVSRNMKPGARFGVPHSKQR